MKKIYFILVFAFIYSVPHFLFAQNIYLKAGALTAKGSLADGFRDYVELSSVQYGVSAETSVVRGEGPTVGQPKFSEITFTKNVDILSNSLFKNISAGTVIPAVEIVTTVRTSQGESGIGHKIELKDVFVTSVLQAAADCGGGCAIAETVKIVYRAIRITTYSQDSRTGEIVANQNPYVFNIANMKMEF